MVKIQKIWWWLITQLLRLRGVSIGQKSYVARPIMIYGGRGIKIGNKVRIFPGVRIETHNNGEVVIQDDVSIGQNFHITASKYPLVIGARTTISGNVFVTNIDHNYQEINKHILKQEYIVRRTEIGENCFIGYGVAVQAGTVLGKQCVIGANSVVRGVFPDFCVIVGAPAKIVKQYNHSLNRWERIKK